MWLLVTPVMIIIGLALYYCLVSLSNVSIRCYFKRHGLETRWHGID